MARARLSHDRAAFIAELHPSNASWPTLPTAGSLIEEITSSKCMRLLRSLVRPPLNRPK